MSKRVPKLSIIDMLQCLQNLSDYTAGMTYEQFLLDSKTRDAVMRNIQILGEAANRVPESLRLRYPEVEWVKIIRSRHIAIHEYDGVDYPSSGGS